MKLTTLLSSTLGLLSGGFSPHSGNTVLRAPSLPWQGTSRFRRGHTTRYANNRQKNGAHACRLKHNGIKLTTCEKKSKTVKNYPLGWELRSLRDKEVLERELRNRYLST